MSDEQNWQVVHRLHDKLSKIVERTHERALKRSAVGLSIDQVVTALLFTIRDALQQRRCCSTCAKHVIENMQEFCASAMSEIEHEAAGNEGRGPRLQ
jgi:hypothetical protein